MAGTATQRLGGTTGQRLRCRAFRLELEGDPALAGAGPLALAGERGFAWRSETRELVAFGSAATIPLASGPGRLERAPEDRLLDCAPPRLVALRGDDRRDALGGGR